MANFSSNDFINKMLSAEPKQKKAPSKMRELEDVYEIIASPKFLEYQNEYQQLANFLPYKNDGGLVAVVASGQRFFAKTAIGQKTDSDQAQLVELLKMFVMQKDYISVLISSFAIMMFYELEHTNDPKLKNHITSERDKFLDSLARTLQVEHEKQEKLAKVKTEPVKPVQTPKESIKKHEPSKELNSFMDVLRGSVEDTSNIPYKGDFSEFQYVVSSVKAKTFDEPHSQTQDLISIIERLMAQCESGEIPQFGLFENYIGMMMRVPILIQPKLIFGACEHFEKQGKAYVVPLVNMLFMRQTCAIVYQTLIVEQKTVDELASILSINGLFSSSEMEIDTTFNDEQGKVIAMCRVIQQHAIGVGLGYITQDCIDSFKEQKFGDYTDHPTAWFNFILSGSGVSIFANNPPIDQYPNQGVSLGLMLIFHALSKSTHDGGMPLVKMDEVATLDMQKDLMASQSYSHVVEYYSVGKKSDVFNFAKNTEEKFKNQSTKTELTDKLNALLLNKSIMLSTSFLNDKKLITNLAEKTGIESSEFSPDKDSTAAFNYYVQLTKISKIVEKYFDDENHPEYESEFLSYLSAIFVNMCFHIAHDPVGVFKDNADMQDQSRKYINVFMGVNDVNAEIASVLVSYLTELKSYNNTDYELFLDGKKQRPKTMGEMISLQENFRARFSSEIVDLIYKAFAQAYLTLNYIFQVGTTKDLHENIKMKFTVEKNDDNGYIGNTLNKGFKDRFGRYVGSYGQYHYISRNGCKPITIDEYHSQELYKTGFLVMEMDKQLVLAMTPTMKNSSESYGMVVSKMAMNYVKENNLNFLMCAYPMFD